MSPFFTKCDCGAPRVNGSHCRLCARQTDRDIDRLLSLYAADGTEMQPDQDTPPPASRFEQFRLADPERLVDARWVPRWDPSESRVSTPAPPTSTSPTQQQFKLTDSGEAISEFGRGK